MGAFLPTTDTSAPAPPKEAALASLVDESPQKRLIAQKATPPPSPLLSELLKKGNLISASPRLVIHHPFYTPIISNKGILKFTLIRSSFVLCKQVGEGDTAGSLTNGVQTATAVTSLPPGHEVITGNQSMSPDLLPFILNKTNICVIWLLSTNVCDWGLFLYLFYKNSNN